jgi:hypothetical protein
MISSLGRRGAHTRFGRGLLFWPAVVLWIGYTRHAVRTYTWTGGTARVGSIHPYTPPHPPPPASPQPSSPPQDRLLPCTPFVPHRRPLSARMASARGGGDAHPNIVALCTASSVCAATGEPGVRAQGRAVQGGVSTAGRKGQVASDGGRHTSSPRAAQRVLPWRGTLDIRAGFTSATHLCNVRVQETHVGNVACGLPLHGPLAW